LGRERAWGLASELRPERALEWESVTQQVWVPELVLGWESDLEGVLAWERERLIRKGYSQPREPEPR
jgi:hypothetical protein